MNPLDELQPENRYLRGGLDLVQYVWRRVDEEQLTQVAGNVTYTLILGLVPALAVALAMFTRFPEFQAMQRVLEVYFSRGMIPPNMAKAILEHLTLFASKAARVSAVGALAMIFTTAMMFNLIETTFNRIWGVQEPRPILRRVMIYVFTAFLGPLLLGGSLYLSSYFYLAGRGIVGQLPYLRGVWTVVFLSGISTVAFTFLYRYVPYRHVLWRDAFCGGLFAAIAFEVAKRLFAVFVMQFASYQRIYGAIALIPMFLLWLYVSSLIMLSGAVLTSSLPDFRSGRWRREIVPGRQFSDALFVMRVLYSARRKARAAVDWTRIQRLASLSSAELEAMLLTMQEEKWVVHVQHRFRFARMFRRGKRRRKPSRRALDEWRWSGDATAITLADVYRRFVFQPDESDPVSVKVDGMIDESLGRSLADYFEELESTDPLPAADGAS